MDITNAIMDQELGRSAFTVERLTYTRTAEGTTSRSVTHAVYPEKRAILYRYLRRRGSVYRQQRFLDTENPEQFLHQEKHRDQSRSEHGEQRRRFRRQRRAGDGAWEGRHYFRDAVQELNFQLLSSA